MICTVCTCTLVWNAWIIVVDSIHDQAKQGIFLLFVVTRACKFDDPWFSPSSGADDDQTALSIVIKNNPSTGKQNHCTPTKEQVSALRLGARLVLLHDRNYMYIVHVYDGFSLNLVVFTPHAHMCSKGKSNRFVHLLLLSAWIWPDLEIWAHEWVVITTKLSKTAKKTGLALLELERHWSRELQIVGVLCCYIGHAYQPHLAIPSVDSAVHALTQYR